MLEVKGINAGYGNLEVIHDFSMYLENREIVCIIGLNGSGKSTLLKTIAGIVKPTQGKIVFDGEDITGLEPYEVLKKGICLLPQGRTAFPMMAVLENLQMGAYIVKEKEEFQERLGEVYNLFPVLREKRKNIANKLSGGEQVMLCIARALMSGPKLLLLDEPSLGLAPKVINHVYQQIAKICTNDSSMIIVEQNVRKALSIASRVYVLYSGRKKFEGRCEELSNDNRLNSVYLGALQHESKNP